MKAFVAAFALVFTPGLAHAGAVTPAEHTVIAKCEGWWRGLDVNGEATATPVPGGVCINGFLDAGRDAPILDALKGTDPVTVVIRSGGGDALASMNVAEVLRARPTTLIADTLCASSCADYLIVAARRRVVLDDTLLLYHGGVTLDLLNDAAPQVAAVAKADPKVDYALGMEKTRVDINGKITRQEALLTASGVSPTLFRWMDLINHMTATEAASHCRDGTSIIQYPPQVLANFGLTFDVYGAPDSQAAVDALLHKLGKTTNVCFWKE